MEKAHLEVALGEEVQHISSPEQVFSWVQLHKPLAVVVNVGRSLQGEFELLRHLHNTWPGVPALLVVESGTSILDGVGLRLLKRPVAETELAGVVDDLISTEEDDKTLLLGLLMSYIQFGYSGLAHIVSEYDYGKVGFVNGRLIHAETRERVGMDALGMIVTWKRAKISGLHPVHSRKTLDSAQAEELIRLNFDVAQEPVLVVAQGGAAVVAEEEQHPNEEEDAKPPLLEKMLFDTLLEFETNNFSFEPVSTDEVIESDIVEQEEPETPGDSMQPNHSLDLSLLELAEEGKLLSLEVEDRKEKEAMSQNINETLEKLQDLSGYVGVALVDSNSGMMLSSHGGGSINMEIAAAANSEVVKSKRQAIKLLKLKEDIEDILITLNSQYHLIRPFKQRPSIFFYLVLDRSRSNLALARMSLGDVEEGLEI